MQVHQGKDVISEARCISVVLLDSQTSTYVESRTPTLTTLVLNGAYWSEMWV
jgi:hypothetical protein